VRMAALSGPAEAVDAFLAEAVLPAEAELLGPVPIGPADAVSACAAPAGEGGQDGSDRVQALIRIPRPGGLALAAALRATTAARTARKETGQVRVQLDPAELI